MNDHRHRTQPLFPAWRHFRKAMAVATLALPATLLPSAATATTVSMGTSHGCSVADTSQATCWGSLPLQDQAPYVIKDIKVGRDFSCALVLSNVRCWGNNDFSQLGTAAASPAGQFVDGLNQADQIAVGARHACALLYGSLTCWGDAGQGQLGEPARATVAKATPIPGLAKASHVAAGNGATCAVQGDKRVLCVGTGSGLAGAADAPRTPREVPGIADAQEVSMFDGHACVLRTGGRVSCWGSNRFGELGMPASSGPQAAPVEVTHLGAAAKAVAVGNGYTCALLVNGTVKCWGNNANGQLGTAMGSTSAGLVTGITDAIAISAGQTAACAALQGGQVQCWGQGAGWSSSLCGVLGGAYPEHPISWGSIPDVAICRPQGSLAPMAVQGLGAANDAAQVLDWAQKTMPGTFPAQGASAPASGNRLHQRQYPGGHTLAVNAHGTPHLLYLGPISDGRLLDLGPLTRWLTEASQDEGLQSGMQLQARPYLNLMPGIGFTDGIARPCNDFLVPFAVRGGMKGLPEGVIASAVRVDNSGGAAMPFPIRDQYRSEHLTTDTDWILQRMLQPGQAVPPGMKQEVVLHGIAEGCPVAVRPGDTVDVTVLYSQGNRKGLLRTRATVDAAY
jgi:hypothetical protein